MRVRWVHEITNNRPAKKPHAVECCAICKYSVTTEKCADCEAEMEERISPLEMRTAAEQLWMLLLLMRARPECPFFRLERGLVAKIYGFAQREWTRYITSGVCYTVGLNPCDHIFHSHCIAKWMRRREACPLCNRYISSLRAISSAGPLVSVVSLRSFFSSEHPYVCELDQKEHVNAASAFLQQKVKHAHPIEGVAHNVLFQEYLAFFQETLKRIAPLEERQTYFFRATIKELIRKEYVVEFGVRFYRYVP